MPNRNEGFVDAHVHISNIDALAQLAADGIVAVRDAGLRPDKDRLDAESAFKSAPVKVMSALWALYKKGGYGSLFGVAVENRDEIRAEIGRLKKAGADIIKVMASGAVSLKRPGTITPGGFDRCELKFIVEEAAGLGLGVMAHANGEPALLAAAEAGVRSVEHGFFMTERALGMMAGKEIRWTPTIGALARAAESSSRETRKYVSDLIAGHLKMVRRAHEAGVPLAAGTDCVLPDPQYRKAYDAELSYLERAGIPLDEVMKIARDGGAIMGL